MAEPGSRKPRVPRAQNALGEFLRARRRLVTPEDAGIPSTGRRRAPGLRREELAMLAGVSSPYYIRLEQGHDRHPSAQVLDALGQALRLDEETFAYLKRLAGQVPTESRPPGEEAVRSTVAQLVSGLQDVAALVIGRYRDVLVANRLAQVLHDAYTPGENLLRFLFLDPRARERVIDWEQLARQAVSTLRADSGTDIGDTHLGQLVDELSGQSPQFRDLWNRHDATSFTTGQLRFNNPVVGPITLNFESFPVAGVVGQSLGIAFPTPGGADERKLKRLKTLANTQPAL
ncbi:helix-turn-helix domain-containing protein [Mycobacterium sp. M23085]|uniref:helix-turn-helix domain-containing protein n=1 Tax=Mycobacterium sp. M23085 TaxID=3378087 RepID=UPI003877FB44